MDGLDLEFWPQSAPPLRLSIVEIDWRIRIPRIWAHYEIKNIFYAEWRIHVEFA